MDNLLEIKNLRTYFETDTGTVKASDNVSLVVPRGGICALVGESGCGKSVTAMSVLRLIPEPPGKILSGEVLLRSEDGSSTDLLKLSEKEMCAIRGDRIAMIFQEPMTSLNPVFTVGNQIGEAIRLHQKTGKREARERSIEMLKKVGISNPDKRVDDYPHQMSGGMRQRVMIAMALSCHPELLIADEPTTALDVTIQAQILDLMHQLIDEMGMSLLLITHDLGIVAEHAQNVAVMYAGQIVEQAEVKEIFAHPMHPYTKGLIESVPSLKKKGEKRLRTIPGTVPNLAHLPLGCSFQDRCERVKDDCRRGKIVLEEKNPGHLARCLYPYS
ncbi:MAG: ABC transporter ATP-binding protein [Deltaproteobacteria bacterium]|nr:ABC transporter ATP-binding protein [Deltaproteobacteria bacterium]